MKKIIQALSIVFLTFIIASCSLLPEPAESDQTAITEVSTEKPQTTLTATVKPALTATVQPSPSAATQILIKEDLPAYLTVGLEKRSEMPFALERYYYGLYYYQMSVNYGYDWIDDFSLFNVDFDQTTSVDLDGDGKEETITLIGGECYAEYEDSVYSDITVDIDGNRLKLGQGEKYIFELNGVVIDIDKDDGKKEILIHTSGLSEEAWTSYIISYDNKKPRKIFNGDLFNDPAAEGTGYIVTQKVDNYIYYNVLWKLKEDRSGFERVNNEFYPTQFQQFCWDTKGNWDERLAAETQSDEYLYNEPGGNEKVLVKQGTRVFIGLYAKDGWLMILDAKGELLGWLDTDKTDFNEYTGYTFDLGYD